MLTLLLMCALWFISLLYVLFATGFYFPPCVLAGSCFVEVFLPVFSECVYLASLATGWLYMSMLAVGRLMIF